MAIVNPIRPVEFPETRWTVVLQLRSASDPQRRQAFEELCREYWRPLYDFARRCGHTSADAEDLTQGFLVQLLRRDDLGPLGPEKGRLRTFLKAALRNHMADVSRRESRQKRGGGVEILSLDIASAERHYERLHADQPSPEVAFDRQWARTVLRRALAALRRRFADRGRAGTLRELEPYLGEDHQAPPYAEVAVRLGQSENTVAAAVRRLREEFRGLLRQEVADTLAPGEDIDEELHYLLRLAE